MSAKFDKVAARHESLFALAIGRDIEASCLGVGWVLVSSNQHMNRWIAKSVVQEMVRDGVVAIVEDGPRVVLVITPTGRLEVDPPQSAPQHPEGDAE